MNSKRQSSTNTRRFAALFAATLVAALPGVASADKLMLSEITVVAVALDAEPATAAIADELNEAALASVKHAIEADTEAHLDTLQANVEASLRNSDVADES